jgi:hypothetical protein
MELSIHAPTLSGFDSVSHTLVKVVQAEAQHFRRFRRQPEEAGLILRRWC